MIRFNLLHPKITHEHLGLIPSFLDENDEKTAVEQIHENYYDAGGWHDVKKFELVSPPDGLSKYLPIDRVIKSLVIQYPNDPPIEPLAWAKVKDEIVVFYRHSMVAVFQQDYTFRIARID